MYFGERPIENRTYALCNPNLVARLRVKVRRINIEVARLTTIVTAGRSYSAISMKDDGSDGSDGCYGSNGTDVGE